jgi:hypothetical protein
MVMRWETGKSEVSVRHLKAVLDFIGYDLRPEGDSLGARVLRAREGMGLSQRTLATKVGVDPTSVWKVEAGRQVGRRLQRVFRGFSTGMQD